VTQELLLAVEMILLRVLGVQVSCERREADCDGIGVRLLWGGLDSNNPDGLFAGIGIPPLEYGKL
jgi:hypothetical protein